MIFIDKKHQQIGEQYLKYGYVKESVNDLKSLNWIKNFFLNKINKKYKVKSKKNYFPDPFNNAHKFVSIKQLNNFRLEMINYINSSSTFRKNYFTISKNLIENIVGNELAMQVRISLSIQLPKDGSSILPVHADTWSGVSPFEVVSWLPLVDCYSTKSMYILPRNKYKKYEKKIFKKSLKTNDIFKMIKKDLVWLNVKYGEVLVFDQSLPHGNIINNEKSTRWSMNCRFKGIFSPYADKKLGEYYEPITLKPASLRGLKKQS